MAAAFSFFDDLVGETNGAATRAAQSTLTGIDSAIRQSESAVSRAVGMFTVSAQSSVSAGQQIIKTAVDTSSQMVAQARAAVVGMVGAVVGGLGMVRGVVISGLTGAASMAASMAATVGQRVAGFIAGLAPTLASGIGGAVSATLGTVTGALQTALGVVAAPLRALSSVSTTGLLVAMSGASLVLAAIEGAIILAKRTVSPFVVSMTIWGNIGNTLLAGFRTAAGFASSVGGVIQSGVTLVSGALKSAFVTVSGWIKTAWGWAQSAGSFVAANIGSVVSGVASLASTALKAGVALGQVVIAGGALATFSTLVYAAGQSAMEFSRSARDLSGVSGFSLSKSAGLLDRLGIQGIGASSVQSVFQNASPWVTSLKARAFGLSGGPDSPNFLASLSNRFQALNSGGPIQQMQAQSMMKALNLGPEWMRAAQTSPTTQRANTNFQRQIDSNLGLSPGARSKYAEEIPALVSRVSYAFTALARTFATFVLPMVENVLGAVTQYVGRNAGSIRDFIGSAVKTVFARVYPMFIQGGTALITMVASMVTGMVKWGTWAVNTLPGVLAKGATVIAGTLRGWSDALGKWAPSFLAGFAGFLSQIGLTAGKAIAGVTSYIGQNIQKFAGWMNGLWANQSNPFFTMGLTITGVLDQVANSSRSWSLAIGNLLMRVNNAIVRFLPKIVTQTVGLAPISPQQMAMTATGGFGPSTMQDDFRRFIAGPTIPRAAADWAQNGADLERWGANASTAFQKQMNDLASGAYDNGMALANAARRGLYGMANRFESPDGKDNLGRNIGDRIASTLAPGVDALARIEPKVRDFASAAQMYRDSLGSTRQREVQFERLVAIQERVARGQDRLISLAEQQLRQGVSSDDAARVRGIILRNQGLGAVGQNLSYGGGGTAS